MSSYEQILAKLPHPLSSLDWSEDLTKFITKTLKLELRMESVQLETTYAVIIRVDTIFLAMVDHAELHVAEQEAAKAALQRLNTHLDTLPKLIKMSFIQQEKRLRRALFFLPKERYMVSPFLELQKYIKNVLAQDVDVDITPEGVTLRTGDFILAAGEDVEHAALTALRWIILDADRIMLLINCV